MKRSQFLGVLVPFLCAIQCNNIMYMAHECMFYGLLPLSFKHGSVLCRDGVSKASFSHFIPVLRHQAERLFKVFEKQLTHLSVRDINE